VWTPGSVSISDRARYFEQLGATSLTMAIASAERQTTNTYTLTAADYDQLLGEYEEYGQSLLAKPAGTGVLLNPFKEIVYRLEGRDRSRPPCDPLGEQSRFIDSDGSIYPCGGFVGQREYVLGHVDGASRPEAAARFQSLREKWLSDCASCWAFPLCRGSTLCEVRNTAAQDPAAHNRLCAYFQRFIELTLALYAQLVVCAPQHRQDPRPTDGRAPAAAIVSPGAPADDWPANDPATQV